MQSPAAAQAVWSSCHVSVGRASPPLSRPCVVVGNYPPLRSVSCIQPVSDRAISHATTRRAGTGHLPCCCCLPGTAVVGVGQQPWAGHVLTGRRAPLSGMPWVSGGVSLSPSRCSCTFPYCGENKARVGACCAALGCLSSFSSSLLLRLRPHRLLPICPLRQLTHTEEPRALTPLFDTYPN